MLHPNFISLHDKATAAVVLVWARVYAHKLIVYSRAMLDVQPDDGRPLSSVLALVVRSQSAGLLVALVAAGPKTV
jgi:hypothetical protein